MKSRLFLFILPVILLSCEKGPDAYRPFSLYKTNGDYFDFFNIYLNNKGKVGHYFDVSYEESLKYVTGQDSGYHLRVKLQDGFVLSGEVDAEDFFTDVTFKVYYEASHFLRPDSIPLETLLINGIIDREPFVCFYEVPFETVYDLNLYQQYLKDFSPGQASFLTLLKGSEKINILINENKLNTEFKKIK